MRITFLLTQSLESPSGLGRYWPLAKELARLGHQVTILALHHNYPALIRRHYVKEGVTVYYVGQMHVRKTGNQKFYFNTLQLLWISFWSILHLMWAALRVPTDVYHLGKPHPMNGLAVLLPYFLKRKPVYLDCDDYEAASNRFGGEWQRRIVAFFENNLPRLARGITVNTHFMAERLVSLGYPIERIVYVPNGVDRERFFMQKNEEVFQDLCDALDLCGRKIVLYMGSMSLASHAVDLLLESFACVMKAEPLAVLLLVGGGEDYETLRNSASALGLAGAVRFVGRVSPEQVPVYYQLADISVDPVRDTFAERARSPLKLFESWESGVPFVTADVGDRRRILGLPQAGGLAVPGDKSSLAEVILSLLVDEAKCQHLQQLGWQRIEAFYWNRLVSKFSEVYDV